MIVDSSALVAIMRSEPEAAEFVATLRGVDVRASAATVLETAMVLGPEVAARLDTLIEQLDLELVADEPLLFKGDDFTHTDVTPAISR